MFWFSRTMVTVKVVKTSPEGKWRIEWKQSSTGVSGTADGMDVVQILAAPQWPPADVRLKCQQSSWVEFFLASHLWVDAACRCPVCACVPRVHRKGAQGLQDRPARPDAAAVGNSVPDVTGRRSPTVFFKQICNPLPRPHLLSDPPLPCWLHPWIPSVVVLVLSVLFLYWFTRWRSPFLIFLSLKRYLHFYGRSKIASPLH